MSIFNHIKKKESSVDRYNRLSKECSNEEKRKLEQKLLKPQKIPPYTGPRPIKNALDDLIIKAVFKNHNDLNLFKKYFKISNYLEQSVSDIQMIMDLLKRLEDGSLRYEKEKGTFTSEHRNSKRKSKMGKGKSRFVRG